jgi:hypothetical protein
MPHLVRLPRLRTLSLEGNEITDRAICELSQAPALWRLFVANTAVTDEGLRTIASFRGLDLLDVRGTRVTLDGVDRLFRERPDLQIRADGWSKLPKRIWPDALDRPDPPPDA